MVYVYFETAIKLVGQIIKLFELNYLTNGTVRCRGSVKKLLRYWGVTEWESLGTWYIVFRVHKWRVKANMDGRNEYIVISAIVVISGKGKRKKFR